MKLSQLVFDTANSHDPSHLIDLAENADKFGFERFWLGEHYNNSNLWNNPEPLLPILLGLTDQIKIGSAGILLKLHASFRVASSFKLLHQLFPGRVDLGIANGHASEEVMRYLTAETIDAATFWRKTAELVSFYNEQEQHEKKGVFVNPLQGGKPALWLLSTGFKRFNEAIKYGLNYSKSIFHAHASKETAKEELKRFTDQFYTTHQVLPQINLAFAGILTRSEHETRLMKEKITEIPKFSFIHPNIIGTATVFQEQLLRYQDFFGIDDFTFLDLSYSMEQRIENVEILSSLFRLTT